MRIAWLLSCALLLAGCTSEPIVQVEDPVVAEDSFDEFELDDTKEEFGVIRGVVVDATISPIGGAHVELLGQDRNVTTNDSGAFAFKDIVPGVYFLQISKHGYNATQVNVEVAGGELEPDIVKVLIQRIPGTEPLIEPGIFQGTITCSVRIPAAGFNDGCVLFGNLGLGSTQRTDLSYTGATMTWWQGELVWEYDLQTAESLCFSVDGGTLAGGTICGPSSQVQQKDLDLLSDDEADGEPFEILAYPAHLAAGLSGNLVLQQDFEIIYHMFYNFAPPEGWLFSVDGEPVTPS